MISTLYAPRRMENCLYTFRVVLLHAACEQIYSAAADGAPRDMCVIIEKSTRYIAYNIVQLKSN